MSGNVNSLALELEEMENFRDAAEARLAIIDAIGEEMVPLAFVERLSEGENPVTVWREFRELEIDELAERAKLTLAELTAIESGASEPGIRVIARIAKALNVTVDDLVPWSQD